MDYKNKYAELALQYKARLSYTEFTFTAFFSILLTQVGNTYRSLFSIFWESGDNWKLLLIDRVARIRALCDLFVEIVEGGRIEHPVTTLNKVLADAKIDPDDVAVNVATEETDEEITLVHPDSVRKMPDRLAGRRGKNYVD